MSEHALHYMRRFMCRSSFNGVEKSSRFALSSKLLYTISYWILVILTLRAIRRVKLYVSEKFFIHNATKRPCSISYFILPSQLFPVYLINIRT